MAEITSPGGQMGAWQSYPNQGGMGKLCVCAHVHVCMCVYAWKRACEYLQAFLSFCC